MEKMESVFERNKDNHNHIDLVAKEKERVVGTLMVYICGMYSAQCKSFMVMGDFVVDEIQRGKGIGSRLMQVAESKAYGTNCSYIMLIKDIERKKSRHFYKKPGYSSERYCAFKKKQQIF